MKRAELLRRIRETEADLRQRRPDWQQQMAKWEEEVKDDQPEWIVLRPEVEDISTGGQKYLPLKDGSLLAQGYAPARHRVKMIVKADVQDITAFWLELLKDHDLPKLLNEDLLPLERLAPAASSAELRWAHGHVLGFQRSS